MKMSIQQHGHLLKCSEINRLHQIEYVDGLVKALASWNERNMFKAAQIARAKRLGKSEFDEERFMIKRNKPE